MSSRRKNVIQDCKRTAISVLCLAWVFRAIRKWHNMNSLRCDLRQISRIVFSVHVHALNLGKLNFFSPLFYQFCVLIIIIIVEDAQTACASCFVRMNKCISRFCEASNLLYFSDDKMHASRRSIAREGERERENEIVYFACVDRCKCVDRWPLSEWVSAGQPVCAMRVLQVNNF